MTSVSDSVIFRKILSTEESAAIWSDKTRTSYYLSFEAALAKVQAELGMVGRCTLPLVQQAQTIGLL